MLVTAPADGSSETYMPDNPRADSVDQDLSTAGANYADLAITELPLSPRKAAKEIKGGTISSIGLVWGYLPRAMLYLPVNLDYFTGTINPFYANTLMAIPSLDTVKCCGASTNVLRDILGGILFPYLNRAISAIN